MDRREFIKTLGVVGGVVLVGGAAGVSGRNEAELRRESSVDPLLAGVCDIHIHCHPDTRARCVDELTLAEEAKQAGYRALMYKSNDWSCHDRAYLIRRAVPEFEVFGSLCMNRVHGDKVNVFAAEQALKTAADGSWRAAEEIEAVRKNDRLIITCRHAVDHTLPLILKLV